MDIEKVAKEIKLHGFKIFGVMQNRENSVKLIADRKNERVFIKVFKLAEIFKSLESKEWINNEIKMGELIASSSVHTAVTMIEKLYTHKYLLLVYEYYRHRTLEQIITERKLRDRDIKLILRDLIRILDDLRKLGLVHKNLSADKLIIANSMIKFTGLDFLQPVSIHKEVEYRNNQNIIARNGNVNCLAPEVVLDRFVGYKTQIFSFGIILYVITHGFWPYESSTIKQLRNCYLDQDYKPFIDPNLHPKIYYLIQRTIAVDYKDRIGLTEIKKEIHSMYKGIKHHEDNIRTKLFFIRNPNLKVTSNLVQKRSYYEKLGKGSKKLKVIAKLGKAGIFNKKSHFQNSPKKKRSSFSRFKKLTQNTAMKKRKSSFKKFPKIGSEANLPTNKSFDEDEEDIENSDQGDNDGSDIDIVVESAQFKAKAGGFFEFDRAEFEKKKRRNYPHFFSKTSRYERLKYKKVPLKNIGNGSLKLPMIKSSIKI